LRRRRQPFDTFEEEVKVEGEVRGEAAGGAEGLKRGKNGFWKEGEGEMA